MPFNISSDAPMGPMLASSVSVSRPTVGRTQGLSGRYQPFTISRWYASESMGDRCQVDTWGNISVSARPLISLQDGQPSGLPKATDTPAEAAAARSLRF